MPDKMEALKQKNRSLQINAIGPLTNDTIKINLSYQMPENFWIKYYATEC